MFPTNNHKYPEGLKYCPTLSRAFKLTKPIKIIDISECENILIRDDDLEDIYK